MPRLILFGATGDLARRKLFPALAAIGGEIEITAIGRRPYVQDEFLNKHVPEDPILRSRITYRQMDFTDPAGYESLLDSSGGNIVYLSVDPEAVPGIISQIGALDIPKQAKFLKIIVEKPFGRDAGTARQLNRLLEGIYSAEQILRVDHYLFKDGVRMALDLAVQNPSLVGAQSTALTVRILESEGVGTRGAFYDNTGAIRDVLQNHLLNVASTVACGSVSALWLRSLHIVSAQFGQYQGYTEELAVAETSTVETFVRVVLANETVQVFLETGKALDTHCADIEYRTQNGSIVHVSLQPSVGFAVSQGDEEMRYQLPYPLPDAYVRLFEGLLSGSDTLPLLDAEAIQATWEIADEVAALKGVQPLILYPRGGTAPQ